MPDPVLIGLGVVGMVGGLALLGRGLFAQRAGARISNLGSSRIGLLAAGEVRISGQVAAAGVTLTSPIRDRTCVYYHAVAKVRHGENERELFEEERGVGFFVKDASGEVRVFPRGAKWEVALDEATPFAEGRAGLSDGLLLPPGPAEDPLHPDRDDLDFGMPTLLAGSGLGGRRALRYREARIEPGETITVVGRAVPFRDLADPTEVDAAGDVLATLTGAVDWNYVADPGALDDPEVAASYAEAVRDGRLAASPAEAWGNAAIEGFGIGRPTRVPELDPALERRPTSVGGSGAGDSDTAGPGSTGAPVATPTLIERSFELPPDRIVLAAGPDIPLLIAAGTPGEAVVRHEGIFFVGLLGAVLAIASALFLAIAFSLNLAL